MPKDRIDQTILTFAFNQFTEQDAVGVTIVLLTCSYRGQEFVRVGYFINNEYSDPELRENPPTKPQFEKLTRNILDSKPRVTRFKINWDDSNGTANGQAQMDDDPAAENFLPKKMNDEEGLEGDGQNGNDLKDVGRYNENSNSLAMEC